MKVYQTRYFRQHLALCLEEAGTETVYVIRPGNKVLQLVSVAPKDAKNIIREYRNPQHVPPTSAAEPEAAREEDY